MIIKKLRLENFRSFVDQEIQLGRYSCFVGPNGAGKSTVLCALNVFFKEQESSSTDIHKLCDEDFFARDTSKPIRITLTFSELGERAIAELSDYVRNQELVVTATAEFNEDDGFGVVRHLGQRPGIPAIRKYFEAEKRGALAPELKQIFNELRAQFSDLPAPGTKSGNGAALQEFESNNRDKCVLIPSEDNFYGFNSTGKLAQFIQWVYVPAVKDAGQEGIEAKNTAFGKLIARTVRSRTNFDAELEELKQSALTKYKELLEKNRSGLDAISESLRKRLESWAHPNVRIGMEWLSDPAKSVQVAQPVAGIKTGDGDFLGSLSRMGHGLQRSYLLALLQELASSDVADAPTMILACEEPELYQHPPQARHLADVLTKLAHGNNQVIVTTHSPLFVSGDGFEDVRLVRSPRPGVGSTIKSISFVTLCTRIRAARGQNVEREIDGMIAKLHQALRPHISEMFFTRVPILVEGLEDAAYITAALHISGQWNEFRRLGCHLIPVNGKNKLIEPIAIARELEIPMYVVFDADGNSRAQDKPKHERDNIAIMSLLDLTVDAFPTSSVIGGNHAIWTNTLSDAVEGDMGSKCSEYKEAARVNYSHEGGLEKNELFIADWITAAYEGGESSSTLDSLCTSILEYARNHPTS